MKKLPLLLLSALLLLVTACGLRRAAPPAQPTLVQASATHLAITLPPTETSEPPAAPVVPTTPPQLSPTPKPSATPQIIPNQPVTIQAQNVNVRQGPGTLFAKVTQLAEGTKATVIGKARGDDWLYIDTGKGKGWVSTAFTSLYRSDLLAAAPIQDTGDALIIRGQVVENTGAPVPGVEFAAYQGKGQANQNPPDTRGHTLADGFFYIYLPPGSSGVWRVSLTAIDCTSPIMDANCRYMGAFMPRVTDVTLPADKVLEFQYTR